MPYPFHCISCPYKDVFDLVRESSSREDDDIDEFDEVDEDDAPRVRRPAACVDEISTELFARILALRRIVACLNAGVDVGCNCPQLREF